MTNNTRTTIDLKGLKEDVERWRSESEQSFASVVRSAVSFAIEMWDAMEKLDIHRPAPGKAEEWLRQLSGRSTPRTEGEPQSIAELIRQADISKVSDESGISEKRLQAIADGAKPLLPELSLLEKSLGKSLSELQEIYQRDFPDHKGKNGNKAVV